MKTSTLTLLAIAASTTIARNCSAGYQQCGHTLIDYDPKYGLYIVRALGLARKPVDGHTVSDSLFLCSNAEILTYVETCEPEQCIHNLQGPDYCSGGPESLGQEDSN
ncbi:hypothetical protein ACSS6W_001353 [Trichoderma asperelloides]|nr:hypothetical protein LI328DRAFT_167262 [Trichoderma asperelloides]